MITILTQKLGVGTSIGLIVTGQILCAVLIDHYGLFNAEVKTIHPQRLVGLILMMTGVFLIMRK